MSSNHDEHRDQERVPPGEEATTDAAATEAAEGIDTPAAEARDTPTRAERAGGDSATPASTTEAASGVDQEIVATFEAELAEARRQADEHWDRYLRAEAELDNLRKRAEHRLEEALARQRRQLFVSFLEVLDNLERALAHGDGDPAAVLEGVEATYRELSRFLSREGVEPIKAMDRPFDPELHEAVAVVPLPAGEEERVVGVDRQGYTLNGELLRPARVLVGQPSDAEAGDCKAEDSKEEADAT